MTNYASGKTTDSSQTIIPDKQILISPNQAKPYTTITINNCRFNLVTEGTTDTIYIATSDANFITPDGYKVGMMLSQLPKIMREKMVKEGGWGYYIESVSKWNLAFCEGVSCTDSHPEEASRIKWLFRRK